jgi:penicillin-binding protein 2
VCGLIIAGCADTSSAPGGAQGPTAVPNLNDACKTAETFIKGWIAKDYVGMYKLISPKAQTLSQTAFAATYDAVEKELANPAKEYALSCDNATQQGTTAVISYDMSFKGAVFGAFTDAGRIMRLILTPNGWRVAWSTMDIFEGLAGGARLQLTYNPPPRGTIFDRNGKPLARDGEVLYSAKLLTRAYPGTPEDCFRVIASVFRRRYVDIVNAYKGSTGLDYGYWVGNLDADSYNALRPNIDRYCRMQWDSHTTRVYRGNGLAAQMLGYIGQIPADKADRYAGYPTGALVGQTGTELNYERQLAGTPGAEVVIRAPSGTLIRSIAKQDSKPAQDVRTTIDGDFQLAVEQAIADAYNYAQPNWAQFSLGAGFVVMRPDTGEILAVASYPSFDVDVFNPNTYLPAAQLIPAIANPAVPERSPLRNRVSLEYSALASVMKIVSMTTAADTGVFKPTSTYYCSGKWTDGTKFGDSEPFRWDWIGLDPGFKDKNNRHGELTLVQALAASCDPWFFQVGATLNQKDPTIQSDYAARMGLGRPTGITDMEELPGQIPSPDNIAKLSQVEGRRWSVADALNVVIGQGDVKVTPLQVAHMLAGVANGGNMFRPYFVTSVGPANGQPTYTGSPTTQGQMNVAPTVLTEVRKGLCLATMDDNIGTAHWFLRDWNFNSIMLCGKTGTAQTGYAQPNGWFAAYAGPTNKPPEIVVVGLVERGREGSETAGPIVRRIVEAYYKLPYAPWPTFWQETYVPLADPNNVSDGGRH